MKCDITTLLFVYNADSGMFNALTDSVHKIISPGTYQCNLCKITYGSLSMKKEWKQFVQSLPVEVVFLHRDEFFAVYPETDQVSFPAVYGVGEDGSRARLLVDSREINKAQTLDDLKQLVNKKVGI